MKKTHFLKKAVPVFITMLLMLTNCSQDKIEQIEKFDSNAHGLKMTPVVEKLVEMGFNLKNIHEHDKYYVVEGDMAFSKNIKDYENSSDTQNRHYSSDNLVGSNYINNIMVFSEISGIAIIDDTGNNWGTAIDNAMMAWNSIGGDSCIHFELTLDESIADIKIIDGIAKPLNNTQFGWAETPTMDGGRPFNTIWINLKYPNASWQDFPEEEFEPTLLQKTNIIAHELGHTIGFLHTDASNTSDGYNLISGTEGTDANSIMGEGLNNFIDNLPVLSAIDILAARTLYGGCETPQLNTIVGPSSVSCTRTSTYNLVGGGSAISWSTSSNLQIVSSTSTSVTVISIAGTNQPIGGSFIEALLSDNTSVNIVVSPSSPPTPNSSITVIGPNQLKTYQSGAFYTSQSNFNNYSNVEWKVISNTFPNAGLHFQITPSNNNNSFHVVIEVLPSAPEGNYIVQCIVSNSCGDYYIEKVLNVKKGLPQFYDI